MTHTTTNHDIRSRAGGFQEMIETVADAGTISNAIARIPTTAISSGPTPNPGHSVPAREHSLSPASANKFANIVTERTGKGY